MTDPQKRFSAMKRQMQSKNTTGKKDDRRRLSSAAGALIAGDRRPSDKDDLGDYSVEFWDCESRGQTFQAESPTDKAPNDYPYEQYEPVEAVQRSITFRKLQPFEVHETKIFENREFTVENSIVDRLLLMMTILQLTGCYPLCLKRRNMPAYFRVCIFIAISLIVLACSFFWLTQMQIHSAILFWLCIFSAWRHHGFLEKLDFADRYFSQETSGKTLNTLYFNTIFIVILIFAFVSIFIAQFILTFFVVEGEPSTKELLNLIAVPSFIVFPVIPVLYFCIVQRIVQFWCNVLKYSSKIHNIVWSAKIVERLCVLQKAMSLFFGPFVVVYTVWPCYVICWTIYNVIKQEKDFDNYEFANWRRNFHWLFIEIKFFIAFFCFGAVFIAGIRTNEKTRSLIYAALQNNLQDKDRYAENEFKMTSVASFLHSQSLYGLSACRIFRLERILLFLILGLLVLYGVLVYLFAPRSNEMSNFFGFVHNVTVVGNFTSAYELK